jgi:hypothetical protein
MNFMQMSASSFQYEVVQGRALAFEVVKECDN